MQEQLSLPAFTAGEINYGSGVAQSEQTRVIRRHVRCEVVWYELMLTKSAISQSIEHRILSYP